MQRISTYATALLVSVFAVSAVAVIPVSAHNGSHEEDEASKTTVGDSVNRKGREGHAMTETASTTTIEDKGKKMVTEQRQGKEAKTAEQRQKSCEKRITNISKKLDNYNRHADKHLATFDKIYDRVQAFQTEKKLDADNYDALIAAADAKQLAAVDALAALITISTTVDCAADDPAATVAAVKQAVAETKAALKAYRTSVKDVIKALNASGDSTSQDPTTGTSGSISDSSGGSTSIEAEAN